MWIHSDSLWNVYVTWQDHSAMFSNVLVLHVTNQTNLYVVQYGKGNLNILENKIRTFIVVLFL